MPSIFSRIKMAKDTLSPLYYSKLDQLQARQFSDRLSYENAIKKLNSLQTNAAVLQQSKERGRGSHVQESTKVDATSKYLLRTGISLEKLDTLSIIHVSGTKGKGTTCALCESVLREHGYKTGFYSSPHLVAAKERIRINGVPLSSRTFAQHFNDVFEMIASRKEHENDMPAYFKFLTVMAFNVFIKEKVDVAIVEVGIGGEYDCTNCIRTPAVLGITSLGLDHTGLLGHSLSEIAWQKSGIMKRGATAFTVAHRAPEALQVLKQRAINRQCELFVSPSLDSYLWDPSAQAVRNVDNIQALNMSLALQLANYWMTLQSPYIGASEEKRISVDEDAEDVPVAKPFAVTAKMTAGLRKCKWPGRTQIIPRSHVTYFLDGAHTEESVEYCLNWFTTKSKLMQDGLKFTKILVFNVTGQRDADRFLRKLSTAKVFEYALFTTNMAHSNLSASSDQVNYNTTDGEELKRCESHLDIWRAFNEHLFAENSRVVPTVSEALSHVSEIADKEGECHVLVTGSLRLVGATLAILDPDLIEPPYQSLPEPKPLENMYSGLQAAW